MNVVFVKQASLVAAVIAFGVVGAARAGDLPSKPRLSESQLDVVTAGAAAAVIGLGEAVGAGADGSSAGVDADLTANTSNNGAVATAQGTVISTSTGKGAGAGALTSALVVPLGNRNRSVSRTHTVGNATNAFSTSVAAGVAVSVDPFVRPARP